MTLFDKNIDADFAAFVGTMLAKKPEDRPENLEPFVTWMEKRRVFKATPKKVAAKGEEGGEGS